VLCEIFFSTTAIPAIIGPQPPPTKKTTTPIPPALQSCIPAFGPQPPPTKKTTTPIPPALQSFIPAFGPQPPGCVLPRDAWVQPNNPRTGVGRLAANMKLMGLCGSDLCECGEVRTAHHVLHDCTKFLYLRATSMM